MTAQVNEKLIYNGVETEMAFSPPIPHPDKDSRFEEVSDEEAMKDDSIILSTACWRGYIGTWEIQDDKFLLVRLRGKLRIVASTPILADWFTGVLRVPHGEVLAYRHMGFKSIYERETLVKVEQGKVIKNREIDNRGVDLDELMQRDVWEGMDDRALPDDF